MYKEHLNKCVLTEWMNEQVSEEWWRWPTICLDHLCCIHLCIVTNIFTISSSLSLSFFFLITKTIAANPLWDQRVKKFLRLLRLLGKFYSFSLFYINSCSCSSWILMASMMPIKFTGRKASIPRTSEAKFNLLFLLFLANKRGKKNN